jgi:hypothetical protein
MPKTLMRPTALEDETGRGADITGSDIVAAWLAVLLVAVTVLTTLFFQ